MCVQIMRIEKTGTISFSTKEDLVLIITMAGYRCICDGVYFQEHVWGAERASLWLKEKDNITCYVGAFTLIPVLDQNVFFVSHKLLNTLDIKTKEKIMRCIDRIRPEERNLKYLFVTDKRLNITSKNFIFIGECRE